MLRNSRFWAVCIALLLSKLAIASQSFAQSEPTEASRKAFTGIVAQASNIDLDPEMERLSIAAGYGPRWATGYANRAKELLEKGRGGESHLDEAFIDANRAVGLEPSNARARMIRAELHSARGNSDAAIADLTVAIGTALSDPAPLNARGVVLARRGDYTAAIADFDAALDVEGGAYTYALYNRAYLNEKLGKTTEAIEDYDAAIDVDPEFAVALGARGLLKKKLGRSEEAVADLEAAAKKLRTSADDDIRRKMANLVIDALGKGPPGRYSFCNLERIGIELIGPLPEDGDFLAEKHCGG